YLGEKNGLAQVRFRISDTGIGISSEDARKIFDPFYQAEGDTNRNYGGTGLGLSISKGLVELMEGELHLKSEVGEGSEFSFILPMKPGMPPLALSDTALKSFVWPGDKKLLVAEDHEQNIMVLRMILNKINANADWVKNGEECLQKARETAYDIILMDMHMPVLDGYAATRILRKEQKHPLVIIGLTAANEEELNQLEPGMLDAVLIKPYRPEQLYLL